MRRRLILAAALLGTLALGRADAAREPASGQTIAAVRPSVARVQARDCADGADRNASGFLFERADRLVTALHVVAGCQSLHAYFEEAQATIPAVATHSSAKSDLAILKLDRAAPAAPLPPSPERLAPGDRMMAVGYAVGQPTKSDFELRLASGGARLRDALNETAFRQVRDAGVPSLDLKILRIHGHLLPGLSGAPIIDAAGRVLGVGDGGLEQGTVSLGWGVPASEISALAAAPAVAPQAVARAAPSLFAAEVRRQANPDATPLLCGDRTFRNLRTRPYPVLAQGTDSPLLVGLFMTELARVGVNPAGFQYDIYVEDRTGAAVAIPAGWSVQRNPDNGYCVALPPNGAAGMVFVGRSVANFPDADAKARQFEFDITGAGAYFVQLDADWTYMAPYFRPDGLIVNRKSALMTPFNAFSGLPAAYGTETLLVRDDLFLGVSAFHQSPCLTNAYQPGCNPDVPAPMEFIQAAIGSALSTMPCGPNVDRRVINQFAAQAMQAWPNALCSGS